MTTGDFEQSALPGIRAVYEDRPYDLSLFRRYFTALDDAANACVGLALQNPVVRDATPDIEQIDDAYVLAGEARQLEIETQYLDSMARLRYSRDRYVWNLTVEHELRGEWWLSYARRRSSAWLRGPLSFEISGLRIESPMELTVVAAAAASAGGGAAVAWYVVHLLAKVVRHPEDIGARIPRLIAGWQRGMTEKEQAQQEREEARRERIDPPAVEAAGRLAAAGETLKELPATEVTAIGVDEPPDDLVAAFTD